MFKERQDRVCLLTVAGLAGAALMLEGGLLRLLAVAQFYHFAFLVVSLALLGFGASGSLLTAWTWLETVPLPRLLQGCSLAFAGTTGLAYLTVNFLPFDSYTIAWQRIQLLYFVLYYLALALPFLCSGLAIGAALARSPGATHRVYAANLVGSALGAALGLTVQAAAGVPGVVLAAVLIGLAPLLGTAHTTRRLVAGLLLVGLLAFLALTGLNLSDRAPLGLVISPYKGLAAMLRYPGATRIFGRWNAYTRVDVIAQAGTRQLPGLSYTYPGVPPPQHGLSVDAGANQPITLAAPRAFPAADYLPEALAFHLASGKAVLVLEPGGGLGVLQALAGGADPVTAVLGNPLVRRAVARTAPEYDVYNRVRTVLEPGRVFLQRDRSRYDLVFVPLTDPYQPVANGAYSLAETYMLTQEALAEMLDHLTPSGTLAVTRWAQTPPSESIRIVATVVEALARRGHPRPGDALLIYRGVQTVTILVRPAGWSPEALAQARAWLDARRFDLVWAPDIRPEEVNRYNRLPESAYHRAVSALLAAEDRRAFYRFYPFAVEPATDDRPFFFHFFTWSQTREVLATLGRTWQPFGGSGYFVLFIFLGLAVLLSGVLILGPLGMRRRSEPAPADPVSSAWGLRLRTFGYFGLLGLAFLCVEIPLIQRWILLLGHASYAFAGVVTTLLLGAGVGSLVARQLARKAGWFWVGLVLLAVVTPWATQGLIRLSLGWPLWLRAAAAVTALLPMAVLMGAPFPLGLAWLERRAPGLVPWAWAVNGCASVVAGVLAAILALSGGFTLVLLVGATAYAAAGGVLGRETVWS